MTGFDGGAEDLHDEYLQATLKKAGLSGAVVAEMQIEYGVQDTNGNIWQMVSRDEADAAIEAGDFVVVRETIHTTWRKATPHAPGS